MNLYERMLNINGDNVESDLKDAVKKTKKELNGLTKERMCKVYNNYLWQNIKEKQILVNQIQNQSPLLSELLINGFQKINIETLNLYLNRPVRQGILGK